MAISIERALTLVIGELGKVCVTPGVRRDLMALVIGPFDALGIFLGVGAAP